jgi:hypothetical protein
VIFIEDAGTEPSLEEIPTHAFREVLQAGVTPVPFAEGPGKRDFLMGDRYEMDVVGHEAPAEDVHPEALFLLGKEPKVGVAVFVCVEDVH